MSHVISEIEKEIEETNRKDTNLSHYVEELGNIDQVIVPVYAKRMYLLPKNKTMGFITTRLFSGWGDFVLLSGEGFDKFQEFKKENKSKNLIIYNTFKLFVHEMHKCAHVNFNFVCDNPDMTIVQANQETYDTFHEWKPLISNVDEWDIRTMPCIPNNVICGVCLS